MKNIFVISYLLIAIFSCEPVYDFDYEKMTISKGSHSSRIKAELLEKNEMSFFIKFDSSAIYSSQTEVNQWDTNKLFGFSDCNSHHHQNSARFGWRWLEGKIDIMVYCYVNGERIIEKIGETDPHTENYYNITLTKDSYNFTFDGETLNVPRKNICDKGAYYTLWPYFGGNEKAPHDINIFFKNSDLQ